MESTEKGKVLLSYNYASPEFISELMCLMTKHQYLLLKNHGEKSFATMWWEKRFPEDIPIKKGGK